MGASVEAGFCMKLYSQFGLRLDEQMSAGGTFPPPAPSHSPVFQSSDFAASFFFTISMSMVMVTSYPTTTPPLSIVAFHFTPKSCRLIFVVAVAAARRFPQGSFMGQW